jgi:hypothetical protein
VREALEAKAAEYDGDSKWWWDIWDQDGLGQERGHSAPRLGYRFAVGPEHHMSD